MSKEKQGKNPTEKKEVNSVSFENKYLENMLKWLNVPLHGAEASSRNRVVEVIGDAFNMYEKDRIAMNERNSIKDEKTGKPVMYKEPNDNRDHYKIADMEAWKKEYEELASSKAIFDILPSTRPHWRVARDIFKNTKVAMDIETTTFWEMVTTELSKI